MKKSIMFLTAASAVLLVRAATETRLFEGIEPRPSADGRRILHSVRTPAGSSVAIWENGARTWVDVRAGNACYADWAPNGQVIYTYGHDTQTAFAATTQNATSGYNLYLWNGRETRPLTAGRHRDYAPCVSPDGKMVYYSSTAEVLAKAAKWDAFANSVSLFALPLCGGKPQSIHTVSASSAGAVGPRVSPDGKLLAWAQVDGFFSTWRIAVARAETPASYTYLTPRAMAATAPSWRADGRYLAFTGFKVGDPGWGVYIQRLADGATRRVCAGENPAFAADGSSIYFDRAGSVWQRALAAEDLPSDADCAGPVAEVNLAEAICARAEIEFQPAKGFSYVFAHFLKNKTGGEARALQLFFREGKVPEFATRRKDGLYAGVSWCEALKPGERLTITGVRLGDSLYISVNDAPPKRQTFSEGLMTPVLPTDADLSKGMNFPGKILSCKVTRGWPRELPYNAPLTRKQLFGGAR